MIKSIIFVVLVLGAFCEVDDDDKDVKLIFNNELVLSSFSSTDVTGDVVVAISSLTGNDATVPLTVQLMEITGVASPLTSANQIATQDCTFVSGACSLTFTAPTLNSANKYSIRVSEATQTHRIAVTVTFSYTTAAGIKKTKKQEKCLFLTPEGPTKPGFKFTASAGVWTANFKIAETPAPTVSQWVFSLWSVNANVLTAVSTQTVTSGNSVSFTIVTAGHYVLTTDLQVSAIDATTKYPIVVNFKYGDLGCPSGQFFDRTSGACAACSTITNAVGTTTYEGVCDCNSGFYWSVKTSTCTACKGTCSIVIDDDHGKKDSKPSTPRTPATPSTKGQDIKQLIKDFNSGNLRKNGKN